jgi:IclR family pca regulon transcriptional regulator
VREQGYSLVDQELEYSARSIAVPIRNMSGRTVASVTVGLHVSRCSPERVENEILPVLFSAQRQLAEILP